MTQATVQLIGMEQVQQQVAGLDDSMFESAKKEFNKSAFIVKGKMANRSRNGPLHARTGELARSWRSKVYGNTLETLGSEVFSTSPYALIHEKGGTIRAKNAYKGLQGGPYLNIPSSQNQTAAGVTRMTPREAFNAGANIIPLNNAPKAKFMILLNGQPMYWLVKEVTIPAKLGLETTARDEVQPLLARLTAGINGAWNAGT
jgi:hypothetical protein